MPQFDPSRPDMSPYGFSCQIWRPTHMSRSDRHNEVEMNFIREGKLAYVLAGRRVEVEPGRLTAFWACVPHQIVEFEGVEDYFVMTIPLTWFLQWRLPDPLSHAVLHGEVLAEPDGSRGARDWEQFREWHEDLSSSSPERRKACALEVEARWRRLAQGLEKQGTFPRGASPSPAKEDLSWAEQMARFIALNYARPLTVKEIASEVGLHPNYAMTLFQHAFGTTLIHHVTEHRLHHAQRLLATSEEGTSEVAFLAGFGSVSRFYECFKASVGCTPREYREALRRDGLAA